jgi:murein DD-endopeptidase MepM/ murein hydrolase activator NlpD
MIRLHSLLICIGAAIIPVLAYGSNGGDDAFVISKTGAKFYALPSGGSTDAAVMGARVVTPNSSRKTALYSDAVALRSGFMRIDRDKITVPARRVVRKEADATTVASRSSAGISRTDADAATLSLFGNESTLVRAADSVSSRGYRWPLPTTVAQHISSGFGMRADPFHGGQRFHGGIDIAAPLGTSVLAAADGVVTEAGSRGGFGTYITLTHADGTETMYNHLSRINVTQGSKVRAGQTIAQLGTSGRTTGPHLDFRIKRSGQRVDPMLAFAGKLPVMTARAERPASSPSVRSERGVKIITPRERLAMSGGFIRVR